MPQARTIQLIARPDGTPKLSDFRIASLPLPDPQAGEVLLQMLWLSLDPYMRLRLSDARSYSTPIPLGDAPPTEVVARVLVSRDPSLATGDMVLIDDHWRDHAVRRASDCKRLDPSVAPVQSALGVLGMTGRTAYVGLKHIGKPKAGETLVVGAATGAVGSIVGQIARLQGARAIGVAGGSEKCRFATETLGFDACLDRHLPDLPGRLAEVCPDGVDVYFELTGGKVLDAVLPLLNEFARIPACGTVASYNATALPAGPDRLQDLMRLIVSRSLTVCGFIVDDHEADRPAFEVEMTAWLASGQVKHHEHIAHGLDSMVPAFIGMLDGQNLGKTLVRLDQA